VGTLTSEQHAPYIERFTLALILPRLLLLGQVGLIAGFGIVIVGVLGMMRHTALPANPFSGYADIFPGQSQVALRSHGFTCWLQDYNYHDPTQSRCGLNVKTGDLSHIEVVHSKGVIHQITFDVRDYSLSVGDLVVMLDLANVQYHGVVLFTWRDKVGLARIGNPAKHYSALRKVWNVTLTDTPGFRP
jgi:hypothetical protein